MAWEGLTAGRMPRRSTEGYKRASTHRPPQIQTPIWIIATRSSSPLSDAYGSRSLKLGGPDISARNRKLSNQLGACSTRADGSDVITCSHRALSVPLTELAALLEATARAVGLVTVEACTPRLATDRDNIHSRMTH